MKRGDAWTMHISMVLVGGTGLIYAWMRYLAEPTDPYAVVNHPWQPFLQHLHIWTAPLLVFGAGLIWRQHIWNHWRQGVSSGRRSGISLLLTLAPMVTSGYLIQTTITQSWRTVWVVVHVATSGIWLLGYAVHYVALFERQRRLVKRRAEAPAQQTLAPQLAYKNEE